MIAKGKSYDFLENIRGEKRGGATARVVEALRNARGVILSSPSYHGLISGHIKNALDYTEDLRNDRKPYLAGRVVGVEGHAVGRGVDDREPPRPGDRCSPGGAGR